MKLLVTQIEFDLDDGNDDDRLSELEDIVVNQFEVI